MFAPIRNGIFVEGIASPLSFTKLVVKSKEPIKREYYRLNYAKALLADAKNRIGTNVIKTTKRFNYSSLLNFPYLECDCRVRRTATENIQNSRNRIQFEFAKSAQQHSAAFNTMTTSVPNKTFNINDYDIIGFDLDGTLLRYDLNEMVPLEYELLRHYLVEEKQYPKELLQKEFDMDFLQRGLVIDLEQGNILKLSNNAQILRATHGTRLLSDEEICKIYGVERQWSISNQFFKDPLSTWNGPLSDKLRTLLDYFDIGASLVFAQAIDLIDEAAVAKNEAIPKVYKVWPDILDGLVEMYTRENFSNGKSKYFSSLQSDPKRYIIHANECVLQWLKELRKAGKCLFLLTGSNIDFANFTATYNLGSDWQDYFDCVICFAKKPGFFTQQRPYLQIENMQEMADKPVGLSEKLVLGKSYSNGNWHQLLDAFADKLQRNRADLKSLYVGDNLIQDIYAPVKHHDVDAVAVCEELLADDAAGAHLYPFQKCVGSKFWGPYFYMPEHQESTLWADIIQNYSRICVPLVDTLAKLPIDYEFRCDNPEGYYPKKPINL